MSHHIPDSWFKHACESAHIALAFVRPDNQIVWCNPAFSKVLGYSVNELTGQDWTMVVHPEDIGDNILSINNVIESDSQYFSSQQTCLTKGGEEVPVVMTFFRFPVGTDSLIGFTAEVVPVSTEEKLTQIHANQSKEIDQLKERIQHLECVFSTIHRVATFLLKWIPLATAVMGLLYGIFQFFKAFSG